MCAIPISIAISESLLAIGLAAYITKLVRRQAVVDVPRLFWFWLIWAGMEVAAWLHSAERGSGRGEIRHLILIAALFVILPALKPERYQVRVWQGIFVTATAGSAVLIVGFVSRMIRYHAQLSAGGDPGFYLRTGGLLHHWMVYATVEVMVFAALLEFFSLYPEERPWTAPVLVVNCLAIALSLTRCLWLACLLLVAAHLVWRRSKRIWVLPVLTALAFWIVPGPLRSRMLESFQPDYYSNAERLQMLRVGWNMIRAQPLFGVGPGRVEELYTRYLLPGEPVPAYHGHLHNNAVQLAAEFGIPTLGAALLTLIVLFVDLVRGHRRAQDRDGRFLRRSGVLGLTGFLLVGTMDYTYGHSLGLILLSFAAVSPLITESAAVRSGSGRSERTVADATSTSPVCGSGAQHWLENPNG